MISRRDYLIAHAPSNPASWFRPVMNITAPELTEEMSDRASKMVWLMGIEHSFWLARGPEYWDYLETYQKELEVQWPAAWADAIIANESKDV